MTSNILPSGADRDFTGSVYMVKNGKILLVKHKKTGFWLQPGGHIDENELPHETARREALEETGLRAKFYDGQTTPNNDEDRAYNLPKPFKINVHRIREGHWHCDFGYLATVAEESEATHSHEHKGTRWFSRKELESGDFDIPENVVEIASEAIEKVSQSSD